MNTTIDMPPDTDQSVMSEADLPDLTTTTLSDCRDHLIRLASEHSKLTPELGTDGDATLSGGHFLLDLTGPQNRAVARSFLRSMLKVHDLKRMYTTLRTARKRIETLTPDDALIRAQSLPAGVTLDASNPHHFPWRRVEPDGTKLWIAESKFKDLRRPRSGGPHSFDDTLEKSEEGLYRSMQWFPLACSLVGRGAGYELDHLRDWLRWASKYHDEQSATSREFMEKGLQYAREIHESVTVPQQKGEHWYGDWRDMVIAAAAYGKDSSSELRDNTKNQGSTSSDTEEFFDCRETTSASNSQGGAA